MKTRSIFFLATTLLAACSASESPQESTPAAPIVASAPAAAELSPEMAHGTKIYKRCRACHTLEEGGKHKVGPNLWGIYGAKTASKEGYAYSKAMQAADIVWTGETMEAYLRRPSAFMPGNKMSFIGLKKQEDLDAVQLYLKTKTAPENK